MPSPYLLVCHYFCGLDIGWAPLYFLCRSSLDLCHVLFIFGLGLAWAAVLVCFQGSFRPEGMLSAAMLVFRWSPIPWQILCLIRSGIVEIRVLLSFVPGFSFVVLMEQPYTLSLLAGVSPISCWYTVSQFSIAVLASLFPFVYCYPSGVFTFSLSPCQVFNWYVFSVDARVPLLWSWFL